MKLTSLFSGLLVLTLFAPMSALAYAPGFYGSLRKTTVDRPHRRSIVQSAERRGDAIEAVRHEYSYALKQRAIMRRALRLQKQTLEEVIAPAEKVDPIIRIRPKTNLRYGSWRTQQRLRALQRGRLTY